jgi:hypothetical protein
MSTSTYFRPHQRAPPTPTSPVRPSTAHSTIRAVTPSPPQALPRPKSVHALNSPDFATFARYVLKAECGGFDISPDEATGLRHGGAASERSSPVESRSQSPVKKKRPLSTPEGLEMGDYAPTPARGDQPEKDEEEVDLVDILDENEAPDTPTPMTREQKRHAYVPLGEGIRLAAMPSLSRLLPAVPGLPASPPPQIPPPHLSPPLRISVSGTSARSTASKHSIFSTPGRDELERKKAMIEDDEGPFARAKSMIDLKEERRKVSTGKGKGKGGKRCCVAGCAVM